MKTSKDMRARAVHDREYPIAVGLDGSTTAFKDACAGTWQYPAEGSLHLSDEVRKYLARLGKAPTSRDYRARCAVCNKDCALRADGTIHPHVRKKKREATKAAFQQAKADMLSLHAELRTEEVTYDPIAESLSYDSLGVCILTNADGENPDDCTTHQHEPGETQPAYHAVVHLLVPCFDRNGTPVDSQASAEDYIAETLRGEFLDWGYVVDAESGDRQTPLPITVVRPYIEGTFGEDD